jgi:hypothetical protein
VACGYFCEEIFLLNVMANNGCVSLCSFNCRSAKNCMPVLHDLCDQYDILLIQEHWLLPHELFTLKNLHNEFYATASSAVDTSSGMLIGLHMAVLPFCIESL